MNSEENNLQLEIAETRALWLKALRERDEARRERDDALKRVKELVGAIVTNVAVLKRECDEMRRLAEEYRDFVGSLRECTGMMTLRNMHELAQDGCRFFYLRPGLREDDNG